MSDDWQPGDLALCVGPLWVGSSPSPIRPGSVHTVVGVLDLPGFGICLRLDSIPDGHVAQAAYFRKIRPHTPDAEDAETIRLLTGKPVREPVA